MRIANNIMAMNAHRQLTINHSMASKSMERLSSGFRINRAGDDAAGLAISEKMRGQIRGLKMAQKNAQDAISLIQTAEGALQETHAILQRMRELAVQAANDTNTLDDRREIQKEIEQLKSEIDRIANTTEFNTQKLLNGSLGARGHSSDTNVVDIVSVTGLRIGDYEFKVVTEATQTQQMAADAANSTAIASAVDEGHELVINGITIDTSRLSGSTDLVQDLIDLVNQYSSETGVVASQDQDSGALVLTAVEYGSAHDIDLSASDPSWMADDVFGSTKTAGVDVEVTITDPDGLSQTVEGVGRLVTYRSAEFIVAGAKDSEATVTVTSSGATMHIGANSKQTMLIDINEISTVTLGNANVGWVRDINVTTQDGADSAITTLDVAIQQVSAERSKLGAMQNRLEHTIANLGVSGENLQAAESRIRDVDMAAEMMIFTKYQILQQASTAMLAQANLAPQSVLQLLG